MRDVTMVELLDWSYRVQQVAALTLRGPTMQDRWERGLAGGGCALAAGPRVDGGGAWAVSVHADAEAVHVAVLAGLGDLERGLVIDHAVSGRVPPSYVGAVAEYRLLLRDGKPVAVRDRHRAVVGYRRREVVLVDGQETGLDFDGLVFARWAYECWAGAVTSLSARRWQLSAHRVTGPGVALRPWEERQAA